MKYFFVFIFACRQKIKSSVDCGKNWFAFLIFELQLPQLNEFYYKIKPTNKVVEH